MQVASELIRVALISFQVEESLRCVNCIKLNSLVVITSQKSEGCLHYEVEECPHRKFFIDSRIFEVVQREEKGQELKIVIESFPKRLSQEPELGMHYQSTTSQAVFLYNKDVAINFIIFFLIVLRPSEYAYYIVFNFGPSFPSQLLSFLLPLNKI